MIRIDRVHGLVARRTNQYKSRERCLSTNVVSFISAHSSGTTVTLVIIDGSVVTVASVGDSRCVLEAEGSIYYLSADHRFDASVEE